ncbi:alpha/beta fold hydrolase [Tamlana fucoidanivorans]|uniref:Alpha/beta fold hydrolase n=1 Tax=Allotamlana fucoidanivorans TaxID=2583814 RepID=A0A5C4SIJ4_9FLAO|nr:alpha/beta fold hydrolase [Tamlana fucoidanivorans]TNJ42904.1 alpha/beta fold hydrolase [Tamlana fucoidanivorans]
MPVIESTYKPRFYFKNGFVSTVYSGLIRRVSLTQHRERFFLPDEDFLDLDWSFAKSQSKKLVIVLHGLEGNGQRPYMKGVAKLFNNHGVDAVCVNFRGCSGEDNLSFKSYHSGETGDLEVVITHVITEKKYTDIYLSGISLGANVILKYLGEQKEVPFEIKKAVVFSAPCYLPGAAKELHTPKNFLYHNRFLKHLLNRLKRKQIRFPELLSSEEFNSIKTLTDFDRVYTAKAHGFEDALDYYLKCSSLQFLEHISIPTLVINALNDSFLSSECYPVKEAKNNPNLFLEMPQFGGHAGFIDKKNVYYNEKRALEFIQNKIKSI